MCSLRCVTCAPSPRALTGTRDVDGAYPQALGEAGPGLSAQLLLVLLVSHPHCLLMHRTMRTQITRSPQPPSPLSPALRQGPGAYASILASGRSWWCPCPLFSHGSQAGTAVTSWFKVTVSLMGPEAEPSPPHRATFSPPDLAGWGEQYRSLPQPLSNLQPCLLLRDIPGGAVAITWSGSGL